MTKKKSHFLIFIKLKNIITRNTWLVLLVEIIKAVLLIETLKSQIQKKCSQVYNYMFDTLMIIFFIRI